jgi:peptide/nickel transport system permease protein
MAHLKGSYFMVAYISRRIGVILVILLGSSFILYNLAAISGDPLDDLRTSTDPNRDFLIAQRTRQLQLNVPPPLRYFYWLRGVFGLFIGKANFGITRAGITVGEELKQAIPVTIRLVFAATIIAIILGIAIGIITALRQYSRFDYSLTLVSFLMLSLPVFWVAVLAKEYLAISFNNFLRDPVIPISIMVGISGVGALFWASLLGRSRAKFWSTFAIVFIGTAAVLKTMELVEWFTNPRLGPILVFAISVGIAFGITQLSVGLTNRKALKAALAMSVVALISYYPANYIFDNHINALALLVMLVLTIAAGVISGFVFSKIDRGPIIRTAVLTAFLSAFLILVDKFMRTWSRYSETDAINYRPVPTIQERNSEVDITDFWLSNLDVIMHLFLPTLILTLGSFAGYVRFSRGTILEVLNQDYIRTARAKGLTERTVIMRHAFRNTLIPISTIIVGDFAGIIGGAIITENVFGWSGMGTLFRRGIFTFDLNLLMGVFFVTATLTLLAILLTDILYSALDPRIRVGSGK